MKKENALNLSLLILRLIVGAIFVAHGAQKLFGMFGGIGLAGTTKMMEGLGFSNPYKIALIWSCAEFFSGLALIMGILSRYASLIVTVIMFISILKINLEYGFFIQNGGCEYNLLIIGSCIPLMVLGGGNWSVWDA